MEGLNVEVWRWTKSTRKGHRARGFQVELSRMQIYRLGMKALKKGCPLCGCRFIPTSSDDCQLHNEISLDVVDQKRKVLDKANTRVVCCSCNRGRGRMTDEMFIQKCMRVAEKHGGLI